MTRVFTLKTLPLLCGLLFFTGKSYAQAPAEKVLVVNPKVGEVIDFEEKAQYKLFPFYPDADFQVGRFLRNEAGEIVLETILKTGKVERRPYTQNEFDLTGQLISAQSGTSEVKTVAPPVAPVITGGNTSPGPSKENTILSPLKGLAKGKKVYYIILSNNQKFFATIAEKRQDEYVFRLEEGTMQTVAFNRIRYMRETDSKLHGGTYWIPAPQDSRLYFAPTGYGLERGDGYLQIIDLFLVAANYGVTDNVSIGGMMTVIPGLPLQNQIFFLTPKYSLKTSPKTSVSSGILYASVVGNTFGIVYMAGTYGNTNNHITGGVGYGFINSNLSKTPVLMTGGVLRATNRLALMSENYIVPLKHTDDNGLVTSTVFGGLYGLRFIWPTINFDLAAGYLGWSGQEGHQVVSTGIWPVYGSLTFKFGNRKVVGKAQ